MHMHTTTVALVCHIIPARGGGAQHILYRAPATKEGALQSAASVNSDRSTRDTQGAIPTA